MFFNASLISKAEEIIKILKSKNLKIVTAESCTAGLICALLTEVSGASEIFDRSFVTYSNEAKEAMICVKKSTLEKFGAVSEEVAEEMALGALKNSNADMCISVTGVAGPNGGTLEKPIGLVFISLADKKGYVRVRKFNFGQNSRYEIRKSTIIEALSLILDYLDSEN